MAEKEWHGSPPKSEEKMVHEIIWIVKNRVKGKAKFKMNIDICKNWGIDVDILMWFFDSYSFPVCHLQAYLYLIFYLDATQLKMF